MLDLFSLLDDPRAQARRPLPGPPPDGTTAGEVTLLFRNEPSLVVPAYRIGALAVHRTVAPAERWGVSHAGTGRLVRAFADLAAAVECARRAAGAIDWAPLRLGDTPETLVGWTPEMAAQLVAAIGPGEPGT
jgi:hypothetical protein